MMHTFKIVCAICFFVDRVYTSGWETPCEWYLQPDTSHTDPCKCGTGCGIDQLLLGTGQVPTTKLFNVVYNKPTVVHSRLDCQKTEFVCTKDQLSHNQRNQYYCYCTGLTNQGCAAVNGHTSNQLRSFGFPKSTCDNNGGLRDAECAISTTVYPPINCVFTNSGEDDPPWLLINMVRVYTISQVFWVPMEGRKLLRGALAFRHHMWNRWRGLQVLVDSTMCARWYSLDTTDQYLKDIYFDKNNITMYLDCTTPIKGRTIRFQKTHQVLNTLEQTIEVCEIQSYVCQPGYYITSGSQKKIGFNNVTFTKYSYPSCSPCIATELCYYGCDNYYGCLSSKAIAYNVAIDSTVITVSSETSFTSKLSVVDGVALILIKEHCFETARKRSTEPAHYLRITINQLSSIQFIGLSGNNDKDPVLCDIQVRVARQIVNPEAILQNNDVLCTNFAGAFLVPRRENNCTQCESATEKPTNCPQGRYVTIAAPASLHTLRICELEIFGSPHQDLDIGVACDNITCGFVNCKQPSVCHAGRRKCMNYIGFECNVNEDCLEINKTSCEARVCKAKLGFSCKRPPAYCTAGLLCRNYGNDKLCKAILGLSCLEDDHCVSNLHELRDNQVICDFFLICKIAVNAQCSTPGTCVSGSSCVGGFCSACKANLTQPINNTGGCRPVFYGKQCTTDANCDPLSPKCNTITGTCVCSDTNVVSTEDFSCGPGPGSDCQPNTAGSCNEGLTCENLICRIAHKASCRGTGAPFCVAGDECDSLTAICKKPTLHTCTDDESCLFGSVCVPASNNAKQCTKGLGLQCTPGAGECGDHYDHVNCSPTLHTCVLEVGGICNPFGGDRTCMDHLNCTSTYYGIYKCSIGIGSSCNGSKQCTQGSECNSVGKCSLLLGSDCKTPWRLQTNPQNETCGPEDVCDIDHICRWKVGTNCLLYDSYCTVTSICNTATNKCECLSPGITIAGYNTCVPSTPCDDPNSACLVGGGCADPSVRCVDFAECSDTMNICICSEGYSVTAELKCKLSAGKSCELQSNTTNEVNTVLGEELCAPGLICDFISKQCEIKVGYPCFKMSPSKSQCILRSQCDVSGKCKLELEADCRNNTDNCKTGLVCSVFGKCTIPVKPVGDAKPDVCYDDKQCVVGANCNITEDSEEGGNCLCNSTLAVVKPSDGQCYPMENTLGGKCTDNSCTMENAECKQAPDRQRRCLCATGFEPDELTLMCKMGAGSQCGSNADCVAGNVCDNGACKLDIGKRCYAPDTCRSQAKCSAPGVCTIDHGGQCKGETHKLLCAEGTVCDVLEQCKTRLKYHCKNSTDCPAGALCERNTCACNQQISNEKSSVCVARARKVTGKCTFNTCDDDAPCIDNVCRCPPDNFKLDALSLSCKRKKGASSGADDGLSPATKMVLWALLLALVASAFCAFLLLKKRKQKKLENVEDEYELRQRTLANLIEEVNTFETKPTERPILHHIIPVATITRSESPVDTSTPPFYLLPNAEKVAKEQEHSTSSEEK